LGSDEYDAFQQDRERIGLFTPNVNSVVKSFLWIFLKLNFI